jgi:hypothetical protein
MPSEVEHEVHIQKVDRQLFLVSVTRGWEKRILGRFDLFGTWSFREYENNVLMHSHFIVSIFSEVYVESRWACVLYFE